MHNRIFILFILALHTSFSINEQKTSKIKYLKKLIVPKLTNDCKNIQCPTKEDHVCVKIKYNKPGLSNNSMYIIMINKCEIEYTKCHPGLEAIVVPMKNCKHELASNAGKRRFKREIEAILPRVSSSYSTSSEEDDTEEYSDRGERVTKARRLRSGINKKLNKTTPKKEKVKPKKVQTKALRQGEVSAEINEGPSLNDDNAETIVYANSREDNDGEAQEIQSYDKEVNEVDTDINHADGPEYAENIAAQEISADNDGNVHNPEGGVNNESHHEDPGIAQDVLSDFESEVNGIVRDQSGVKDTVVNSNEHEDNGEVYNAACPTECPARDVMVCGRCQHGVFRTFSSICHMRMFLCDHRDEYLELMSRYPCILSAPYLANENMLPKGRVSEPNDEDTVLKYIKCRQMAKNSVPDINMGYGGIPSLPLDCNFEKSNILKFKPKAQDRIPLKTDYSSE